MEKTSQLRHNIYTAQAQYIYSAGTIYIQLRHNIYIQLRHNIYIYTLCTTDVKLSSTK